jgi:hypothetical protein
VYVLFNLEAIIYYIVAVDRGSSRSFIILRYFGALKFDETVLPTLQENIRDSLADSPPWMAFGVQAAAELFLSLIFFS